MSDGVNQETLDILARRVLAKAEFKQLQVCFQENYDGATPLGTKAPLRLYIINHEAVPTQVPNTNYGSAVKCVKLCRRILSEDPKNTMICTQKSKVVIDYELILVVEFEDNSFNVLTLPKNLSQRLHYGLTTKAFVDSTVIDSTGAPVVQHQNTVLPYETHVIKAEDVNDYTHFEYAITIPLSSFSAVLRKCELEDPTLQSYILLRNLDYEAEILEQHQIYTAESTSVWTTIVDFSLLEDIIDKLGIDQDIQIEGTPEYVCED